ncbi:unnamed protein product [Closterium sp. NIES-53]
MPPPPRHQPDTAGVLSRAEGLAKRGSLRRAVLSLESTPVCTPSPKILEELRLKHLPAEPGEVTWPTPQGSMLSIPHADFAKMLSRCENGVGVGLSGMTFEHLRDAAITNALVSTHLHALVNTILGGNLPASVANLLTASRLIALAKPGGGARPIAIGECLTRLAAKAALSAMGEATRDFFLPLQYGVAVPSGAKTVIHAARAYLDVHPTSMVLQADIANVFNSVSRHAIATVLQDPALSPVLPFVKLTYGNPSQLLLDVNFNSEPLRNNVTLLGNAADTVAEFNHFTSNLTQWGLAHNPCKCAAWSRTAAEIDQLPPGVPFSQDGVQLLGSFVGPDRGAAQFLSGQLREMAKPLPLLEKADPQVASLLLTRSGPSGSGGVRGAGEAGRGVEGGSAPIASVSTPAKDDVKAFNLEKFSGEDWASWSFRMELLFNHYGLLEVMDGELKRPASEGATKEWDRRSKDGFFLLSQCLSSNQLHHVKHLIKDIQCGSKAWKILKDVHAPSSEAMVVVLERQLHAVKINEGDAVQGAFDQLRDLYVKLSAAGVDYPENIKCYKALSLLLESWGPLVVNLNGMKDSWSLEWIRAQVLQEEFRRKELTAAAGEGGGSAYGMKGFKGRGSKKGKAKEGSGGEQYSGGKRSNKGGKWCGGKCWYCHGPVVEVVAATAAEPFTAAAAAIGAAATTSAAATAIAATACWCNPTVCIRLVVHVRACVCAWNEPLGAVSTMAGPEERGGRGAGSSGEAQAQGQPRDSAMAPMQLGFGPPRDEPRVFGLDKFNGDNFAEWLFKIKNIFDHCDLLEVMEGTEKRPKNDPEKSPWVRKSAQGYLLLGQALGSSQIRHIKPFQREPEKGPKAWAALKGVHAPATAAVAVVLERQMAALRIVEDEAVEQGVQEFFDLLTRLEGVDLNYSELQKKTKLLALLPDSWSSLIINLNRDLPRVSLEDVKRAILQEDFRRRELASADGAEAASIGQGYGRGRGTRRGGGRFSSNNFNGGRGSGEYGSDNKNYGRGRGRFDGECHYCHKSRHMWRNCYKLPDGWTPAQGQEGRGAGGGRGRGRGGRGGRGGGAASMKSAGNESESRDDLFPGQLFFVSTQASASLEKDEGFEEPAAVGKVILHSLDNWVIDSGATYSMTPRADLLTELEPSPVKHVTSALGQRAEVKGMGKAMFKGADGKMVGLKNVLWVPDLASNLIFVRRLQKAGMETSSKGAKTYTARLGERILWDLHKDRDVYNEMWQIPVVPMPKERQVAASISTKGEAVGSGDGTNGHAKEIKSKKCNLGMTSKLSEPEESGAASQKQHKGEENPKAAAEEDYGESMWGTIANAAFSNPTSATGECDWLTFNRQMGHVALPILQQLVKNEMVAGIRVKGEPDEVLGCPTCMQAKFTRYPFSSSEAMAKVPLDEVVMDVVGLLKLGAAGAEYFLTIVDVYTRMTWVYVLSKKSDVAETVKTDSLPMVERQQDRLLKAIRTDRGGEFLSKEFSFWLKKNGIRHSLTMPYSPAMNGIAERANRTITETARGLLIEARLPEYFWPDAVRSACVAKNRALTHVGANKWVPYVEWIGRKPKVDMLRVFGCMCMALVPKHLRHNKLGAKAIWAVHLGMAQNSKGWLLWDPFTKKFLVSRDCKFMENLMYKDWKAENEAKIGMQFGEVKGSGLEHVELPLELSSGSTTTRQSSLVNGGEEAKDVEEEEEEVQQVSESAPTLPSRTTSAPRIRVTPKKRQGLHVPAAEEEGRGKRRTQTPNRLTYEALGKPAKSALVGAALMVGEDEESDYDECAFAFFSPVEMPGEPATLKEALESSDAEEWKKAMESELKSIEENDTWELVELLDGRKAITSEWLFKIKSDANGNIERYKSRLVAKGYQQKEKVDYEELFAPVVKPTTLRTLLAGAAIKG